jgi:hypothetical protein
MCACLDYLQTIAEKSTLALGQIFLHIKYLIYGSMCVTFCWC